MRLIDADAFKAKLAEEEITFPMLDFAPTVDAVPVIRCKDCTHYRGDHEYCENDMFAVESGFCNWAERKEECGHQ